MASEASFAPFEVSNALSEASFVASEVSFVITEASFIPNESAVEDATPTELWFWVARGLQRCRAYGAGRGA
jgi:hypothetical protein